MSAVVTTERWSSSNLDTRSVEFSVVIATFNRPEGLARVLDLLAASVDVSFEVIVVDDGGDDPTLGGLADRVPSNLRLTVIRRPNGGPAVARDQGIRASVGEIVVIVDDDMRVAPTFLKAHGDAHRDGADVVLGRIRSPEAVAELPLFERFHLSGLEAVAKRSNGRSAARGIELCTGNVSFTRAAYDAVGGFDLTLRRCEDRDLGLRFELAGYRLMHDGQAVADHESDHTDPQIWHRRNQLYGQLDERISGKHAGVRLASPWNFLSELPKLSAPLLVGAAMFPGVGVSAGAASYRLAERTDRTKFAAVARTLTSLSYALDYYAGVGSEHPVRRSVLASLMRWKRARR